MNSICTKIKPLLSEYIDNALDPRRTAEVDRHLSTCPDCRQIAADFRANKNAMGSMPLRQTSSAFDAALAQRIAAINQQQAKRSWLSGLAEAFRPSRTNVFRPAFATVSAVAVVAISVMWLTPRQQVKMVTPPAATDTAFIQQCVTEHRSYAENQPLNDFSAQTLASMDTAQIQTGNDADADDTL